MSRYCNCYYFICFILVVLCCYTQTVAQSINILSVKEDNLVEEKYKSPYYDSNGDLCSLLHVVSKNVKGLSFEGNILNQSSSFDDYYIYVPSGSRRIRIKHPDYWVSEVDFRKYGIRLKGGKCYKITLESDIVSEDQLPIDKNGSQTSLVVSTRPFGAIVNLDGNDVGKTPYTLSKIKPGSHRIRVTMENYTPIDTLVMIEKKQQSVLKGLLPRIESVRFISNSSAADVWIDGLKVGQTEQPLPVSTGMHSVKIVSKGYYDAVDSVLISPNCEKISLHQNRKSEGSRTIKYDTLTFVLRAISDIINQSDYYSYKLEESEELSYVKYHKLWTTLSEKSTQIHMSLINNVPVVFEDKELKIKDYSHVTELLENVLVPQFSSHKKYSKGVDSFMEKDYINAYRWFRSAWKDDPTLLPSETTSALSWLTQGFLLVPNQKAAMRYSSLADAGNMDACFTMGWLYENGLKNVQEDPKKALSLYTLSVSKGNSRGTPKGNMASVWNLAWMYENGIGCEANSEMASYLYSMANLMFTDSGMQDAAAFSMKNQIVNKYSLFELYNKKDTENGTVYLREAANMGHIPALKDLQSSSVCYSCLAEDADAFSSLAFELGLTDIDSCIEWLERAASCETNGSAGFVVSFAKKIKKGTYQCDLSFDQEYFSKMPTHVKIDGVESDWQSNGNEILVNIWEKKVNTKVSKNYIEKAIRVDAFFADGTKKSTWQKMEIWFSKGSLSIRIKPWDKDAEGVIMHCSIYQ